MTGFDTPASVILNETVRSGIGCAIRLLLALVVCAFIEGIPNPSIRMRNEIVLIFISLIFSLTKVEPFKYSIQIKRNLPGGSLFLIVAKINRVTEILCHKTVKYR